jgi:hypothetical protein
MTEEFSHSNCSLTGAESAEIKDNPFFSKWMQSGGKKSACHSPFRRFLKKIILKKFFYLNKIIFIFFNKTLKINILNKKINILNPFLINKFRFLYFRLTPERRTFVSLKRKKEDKRQRMSAGFNRRFGDFS